MNAFIIHQLIKHTSWQVFNFQKKSNKSSIILLMSLRSICVNLQYPLKEWNFVVPNKIQINIRLKHLKGYPHDNFALDTIETNALFHHRFVEACKFAFGLRHLVGDDNITDSTRVIHLKKKTFFFIRHRILFVTNFIFLQQFVWKALWNAERSEHNKRVQTQDKRPRRVSAELLRLE